MTFRTAGVLLLAASPLRAELPRRIEDPRIIVLKSARRMELRSGGKVLKTYAVGLGLNPVPPKKAQGDRATPEGEYFVCGKVPKSQFYKALIVSYPNLSDADRGLKAGLIGKRERAGIERAYKAKRCPSFSTKLGGDIEIHGMGSGADWTWGCVALDNPDIDELFEALPVGTPVTIKP